MAVSWEENGDNLPAFRGYVFRVRDLPRGYRDPERWRDYLFAHTVPGRVIDDFVIEEKARLKHPELLEQSWPANSSQITVVSQNSPLGPQGTYSFNPDDHPGAHNCVTWAAHVVVLALGEVLPKVRQGRIKLMAEVLRSRQNLPRS